MFLMLIGVVVYAIVSSLNEPRYDPKFDHLYREHD
jgi:hypothetical protein